MKIDWQSEDNVVLLNPRMPAEAKNLLLTAIKTPTEIKGHFWLTTSGSTGQLKWVLLSKEAVLASAQGVNAHLQSTTSDVWLNPLPEFHVGGLGINARGYLSGATVICTFCDSRWNPEEFSSQLTHHRATLTALVPAQVFDLVTHKLSAPEHLRAIIVGGGAISPRLYFEAVALGWKLLPSYGLTECASQVATALPATCNLTHVPPLQPLPHIKLKQDSTGRLMIKSPALLTTYIYCDHNGCRWIDPKEDGWLTTEDHCKLEHGAITAISRTANFIKIGGESVDMLRLEHILEEERTALKFLHDVAIFPMPDKRLGHVIHLATATPECAALKKLIENYKCRVHPFEQIRQIHYVDSIPRSPLNKVLTIQLICALQKQNHLTPDCPF